MAPPPIREYYTRNNVLSFITSIIFTIILFYMILCYCDIYLLSKFDLELSESNLSLIALCFAIIFVFKTI